MDQVFPWSWWNSFCRGAANHRRETIRVAAVRGFADRGKRKLGRPEGLPRTAAIAQKRAQKKRLRLWWWGAERLLHCGPRRPVAGFTTTMKL